jgi:Rrf2 family nitric oxide-sensitive transcriptional repressor
MRLTTLTDYALRLLIHLAVKPDGRATIAEVARAYAISEAHLMKVTHQLGRAGFVATLRGRGGGIALARPPAEISAGAVVRAMEPDLALVPCMAGGDCAIAPCCRLARALAEARDAFLGVLDGTSLAALAAPNDRIRTFLGMAA